MFEKYTCDNCGKSLTKNQKFEVCESCLKELKRVTESENKIIGLKNQIKDLESDVADLKNNVDDLEKERTKVAPQNLPTPLLGEGMTSNEVEKGIESTKPLNSTEKHKVIREETN